MSYLYRVKCSCGNVLNAAPGNVCPKCKNLLYFHPDGLLSLYRKGSPLGIAGGFGIYIDGEPMGYIGNRETVHIPLPYGTHNLHVAVGMSRKCQDLIFTLTPDNRNAYAKVWMKPGFWANSFVIEPADVSEMPL